MAIMIIGGGSLGSFLAGLMEEKKEKVVLIEREESKIEKLKKDLKNSIIIHGNGSNIDVLKKAGILETDVVVACTRHDEDNVIICQLAKFEFGVSKVVSRINNPKNEWLFTKDMGVDAAVSSARILAKLIEEEAEISHLTTILNLAAGEISLVKGTVEINSKAAHKKIKELNLPNDCIIMTIVRDNKVLLPNAHCLLLPGDDVLSVVADEKREEFMEILENINKH
jgi:trk system potassium uptake protein